MFYRTIAVFIVLFWLTMTGLLIHQQMRPANSAFREIPVAHVVKLFFRTRTEPHDQRLLIYNNAFRAGRDEPPVGKVTQIIPETDERTKYRRLEFAAEFNLTVPGEKRRQHIGVRGKWELDQDLTTRSFRLTIFTHVPADLTTQIEILPLEKLAHYKVESPAGVAEDRSFPLNEKGARSALEEFGFDPEILPALSVRRVEPEFKTTARLAKFPVREGEIDTYLVTVESNGQTLLEGHVDQLGRIVQINCPILAYSIVTEDPSP